MKKIPVLACSSVAILALGLSIALPSGFAQNVENTTNQSVQTISENTIHSETASSGPVTLKASWDETKLGSPTTFHVEVRLCSTLCGLGYCLVVATQLGVTSAMTCPPATAAESPVA